LEFQILQSIALHRRSIRNRQANGNPAKLRSFDTAQTAVIKGSFSAGNSQFFTAQAFLSDCSRKKSSRYSKHRKFVQRAVFDTSYFKLPPATAFGAKSVRAADGDPQLAPDRHFDAEKRIQYLASVRPTDAVFAGKPIGGIGHTDRFTEISSHCLSIRSPVTFWLRKS